MKRLLPLLLFPFVASAADVTIGTAADIADQCYAVGDTVTVSDGTAVAVLGDYVASLKASTITMEHAGWTLLKDSGGTEYRFAVYEPPAEGGDVFFLNFTADANWSAAPWTKVTQNSERTYPNHADDVAVAVNPSKSWGVLTVDGDGVTIGQLVEASFSSWSLSQTGGRIVPLVFERTDGRPPRVALSRPTSTDTSRSSFRFGYDGDNGENYLDVSFRGERLVFDFTGETEAKPAYRRTGSTAFQIGRAKLRVGEGQTIRFENGSPFVNSVDQVQFLNRTVAEITGAGTVENRGVYCDWKNSNGYKRLHPAFYRELGEPPAAFERNFTDSNILGAETAYSVEGAYCTTNSRPMAKIQLGWDGTSTQPTNNFTDSPSVFLQGGFLHFRTMGNTWSDTLFATNDFAKLTIRGQAGFLGNSYGSTRVRHDVRIREFERADEWSTFEVRGFNCRRLTQPRDYLGTIRIDQWDDFAVAPEGVDPANYDDCFYSIVPWITCTANDNGYDFANITWGTEQTFPGVVDGVLQLHQTQNTKNSANNTTLATCGENDNFYFHGKGGFWLNGQDKTIFSLSYGMGETPKYAAGGNFYLDSTASGATLTIKSGAIIMSRQGNWLGQPCDMTKNGKLKLLGSPSYIHAPGVNWNIPPTADMDNNMIWTPVIASNDLVKAGGGWLGLAGDQRNIRGTVAVNAGVLYLGYPSYLKMGYLYHNSESTGWPMHGCATDCDFVVRGGAVLSLASVGYTGKDSDGHDVVDAPVLAWGEEHKHTLTLERSGDSVGGVYVADGVEGVVYEAFYETEDGAAVTFARGTWGSSESAAEHVDDTYFAGPGVLMVQHDRLVRPTMVLIK